MTIYIYIHVVTHSGNGVHDLSCKFLLHSLMKSHVKQKPGGGSTCDIHISKGRFLQCLLELQHKNINQLTLTTDVSLGEIMRLLSNVWLIA